ncbi:AMP-binding protein [Tessaracoccus sp. MC1756]|uniref:AMP-binding protein n=1 Tax=Tessaracoccus sp. MC1756 TaxID=2760311 RepID=UPI0015FFD1B2|nr:AMP-binding protein [Tessaracoccus sp. MC1756]
MQEAWTLTKGRALSPLPLSQRVAGAAPALIARDGEVVDHATLRRRVDELAVGLRTGDRRLAHVQLRPTVDDIVGYLALLEADHVVLLLPEGHAAEAVRRAWPADLQLVDGDIAALHKDPEPRHLLHPDLALLLSTSGSTGSPKLVRLSHANLTSNAHAIAAALALTAHDRGATSLPLHYCFGLSVLHSHLAVGASVALTRGSVLDDDFWSAVDAGVSTLAVVPHMVELMETTGVLDRPHPSLRLVTQAGGRMGEDRVRRTAQLGARHGWGVAVMYGQSEATARIAIQSPNATLSSPGTVGTPVPGTEVRLDRAVPESDGTSGEIVVTGPGVMLGYAQHPDDLALGRMVTELRTGDLGVLDGGLLRIVGRRSGFVKVLGLRIDLARVETTLEHDGLVVCVTGDDTGLRVAVEPVPGEDAGATASRVRRLAGHAAGVGVGHIRVGVLPLARLTNGKVDRAGCDALVRATDPEECADSRQRIDAPGVAVRVAGVLRDVLGLPDVDLDRSFVALGGDSLTHVQASARLSSLLGDLPADWHHRPVRSLVDSAALDDAPPASRRRWPRVEISVVLRAIAAIIICGSHAELFRVLGGAHTLMAVAGYSTAMFGLSAAGAVARWRAGARLLIGVAVPTVVTALIGMAYGRYGWGNVFLVNWATGNISTPGRNELWFVDVLVLAVLVVTALLSWPAIARRWTEDPWRVSMGLLLVGLLARFIILSFEHDGPMRGVLPTVFWLFAAGMALAVAHTRRRTELTLALALLGTLGYFPDDTARNLVIAGGIIALALVRSVPLPRLVVPVVTVLAAASLHIYLIQFHVLTLVSRTITDHGLVRTVAALIVGVLLWRVTATPIARLQDLLVPLRRTSPTPERTTP